MATQYHYYSADMSTFEKWKESNSSILDRCTLDQSWRWAGKTYFDTFRVHLHDEPLSNDYDLMDHREFLERFEVQKEIGHWQGELFNRISDLLEESNINTSSSMDIQNECYVYNKYCSLEEITQIKDLIEKKIGLHCRINRVNKGKYELYMHSNELVLQTLTLNEYSPAIKRGNKPNKKFDPSTDAEDWLTDIAVKMGVTREEAMKRLEAFSKKSKKSKTVNG